MHVVVGPATEQVVLKLSPEGKIHGRVLDADGEPVQGMQIQVMSQQIVNGRKHWQPGGGAQTNAEGVYRVDGVMPGQYIVRTETQSAFSQFMNVASDARNVPDQVFPRT